jgi:hypothetical protein
MSNINLVTRTLVLISIIFFGGCASKDYANLPYYQNIGVKHPSPLNGFTGGVFIEPFASDYIELMQMRCNSYGGLDFSSQTTVHQSALGEKVIQYKCNAANTKTIDAPPQRSISIRPNVSVEKSPPSSIPAPTTSFSLDESVKKCTDLGFKTGTEGFGKCVLQLSK